MNYEMLRHEEKDGVTVVALKKKVKSLTDLSQLSSELSECCQKFRDNSGSRVLVVTGDKKDVFSMGRVLSDIKKERGLPLSITEPIAAVEMPVIACIPGDAIGLGLEMVLACDIRIASEGSKFGLPQVKADIMPSDGGIQRMLRTIGKGKTLEMVLTGEPIEAQEALRIGLISRIISPDELVMTGMTMAHEMASRGPISLEYCKEAINKGMDLTLEQGLRLEADLYYLIHTTQDRTEGIRAFQEKRRPEFKGI